MVLSANQKEGPCSFVKGYERGVNGRPEQIRHEVLKAVLCEGQRLASVEKILKKLIEEPNTIKHYNHEQQLRQHNWWILPKNTKVNRQMQANHEGKQNMLERIKVKDYRFRYRQKTRPHQKDVRQKRNDDDVVQVFIL